MSYRFSLKEFADGWEENHLAHKKNERNCDYHNERYKQGWIPLGCFPFYPALNRFDGENVLAVEIVTTLENEGEFKTRESKHPIPDVIAALEELMHHNPHSDIGTAIELGGNLLLDRKSYNIDGGCIECYVQWYIKKAA